MSKLLKVQNELKNRGMEALLVFSPYNLRYVSNFTGTTGYALLTQHKAFFVTDARYTQQAKKQVLGYEVIEQTGTWIQTMQDIMVREGISRVGFEEDHVTVAQQKIFSSSFSAALEGVSGLIEAIREIKDEEELNTIRKACSISDAAFLHILNILKPGITEIEVANELDFYMRKLGATGVSFDTIVASGYRSAMPHGVASEKPIERGDLVTLDFGCYYKGYVSDMTRTVAVGEPIDQLKEIHAITLEAQRLVNEQAGPGKTGADLDRIARDYIASKGYGAHFVHSTGHGIGLEIHEGPSINRLSQTVLVPGHVITNEPGIYLDGIGGVRIEDDLIVTSTGVEIIQQVPKELIIL